MLNKHLEVHKKVNISLWGRVCHSTSQHQRRRTCRHFNHNRRTRGHITTWMGKLYWPTTTTPCIKISAKKFRAAAEAIIIRRWTKLRMLQWLVMGTQSWRAQWASWQFLALWGHCSHRGSLVTSFSNSNSKTWPLGGLQRRPCKDTRLTSPWKAWVSILIMPREAWVRVTMRGIKASTTEGTRWWL